MKVPSKPLGVRVQKLIFFVVLQGRGIADNLFEDGEVIQVTLATGDSNASRRLGPARTTLLGKANHSVFFQHLQMASRLPSVKAQSRLSSTKPRPSGCVIGEVRTLRRARSWMTRSRPS